MKDWVTVIHFLPNQCCIQDVSHESLLLLLLLVVVVVVVVVKRNLSYHSRSYSCWNHQVGKQRRRCQPVLKTADHSFTPSPTKCCMFCWKSLRVPNSVPGNKNLPSTSTSINKYWKTTTNICYQRQHPTKNKKNCKHPTIYRKTPPFLAQVVLFPHPVFQFQIGICHGLKKWPTRRHYVTPA